MQGLKSLWYDHTFMFSQGSIGQALPVAERFLLKFMDKYGMTQAVEGNTFREMVCPVYPVLCRSYWLWPDAANAERPCRTVIPMLSANTSTPVSSSMPEIGNTFQASENMPS